MTVPAFAKRRDFLILGLVLLCCGIAALLLYRKAPADGAVIAQISKDGTLVASYNLSVQTDGTFTLPEADGFVFAFQAHSIAIVTSPCQNHTCIASGAISAPGQRILCLPERLVITLVAADESGTGVDVIVG